MYNGTLLSLLGLVMRSAHNFEPDFATLLERVCNGISSYKSRQEQVISVTRDSQARKVISLESEITGFVKET